MGFFDRLKKGLSKSRGNLTERVAAQRCGREGQHRDH